MKTEKMTLSIPELCAKLGIATESYPTLSFENGVLYGNWHAWGVQPRKDKILSIGSLFPTDECEFSKEQIELLAEWRWKINKEIVVKVENQCDKCKKNPTKIPEWLSISEDAKEGQREAIRNEFKPHLAKVVGIKMVERCECKHEIGSHEYDRDSCADENCHCKHYKPVQEVEITYEVD
jgi:hypothetical protein